MAQYVINTGSLPNDGTGTPLRTAFNDTNLNFNQIFAAGPVGSNIQIANNTITTTNVNGNLILATNGTGVIRAAAHIQPDQANLRMIGSGTNRFNTVYTQYLDTQSAAISGNLAVTGNLYVTGNTVTANTSVLNVANSTITVSAGAPAPVFADGSGLIVGGSGASFLYGALDNVWQSNLPIQAPAFIGDGSQLSNVFANVDASGMSGNTINANVLYSSLISVGTLGNLSVSGNVSVGQNILSNTITTGEISAIAFFGNAAGLTYITAANVIGNVANATYSTFAGTAGSANLAATATQALNAQNAVNALNAQTANTAQFADIANWANCAELATTAYQANSAVVAGRANTIAIQTSITVTGNVVAGAIKTNNYLYANGLPFTPGTNYSNANVAAYLPSYSGDLLNLGNITSYGTANLGNTNINSTLTVGVVSAQGNIQGGAVYANGFFYGNGTPFTGAGFVLGDQQFYGNGTTGPYTMTQSSTDNAVLVTINGLTQTPGTTYFVSGDQISFSDTINTNELVDIRFLGTAAGGGANTGNIRFNGDTIYDLNGITINNSDLSHGSTSSITIPVNGNIQTPASFINTYGNVLITAGNGTGNNSSWTFDGDGNLTLPTNTSSINYANGQPYGGGTGNVDLTQVTTDIIPVGNNTQSLGNATNQWKDLYVSNATIYFNSVPLTVGEGNVLSIGGANVVTTSGAGNTISATDISVTGNVTAGFFYGDGSNLTGLPEAYGNANVAAYLPTYDGDVSANNVTLSTLYSPNFYANAITYANAAGYLTSTNLFKYDPGTGIITAGGASLSGNVSAQGNIAAQGIISAVGNIVTDGYFVGDFAGNITGNITVPGSNTQVLFNANGNVGAVGGITYNSDSNLLTVLGTVSAQGQVNTPRVDFGASTGNVAAGGATDKITLYDFANPGTVNYAIGVENGNMWFSTDSTSAGFNFYGNTSRAVHIDGTGDISAVGNVTASYYIGDGSLLTNLPGGNTSVLSNSSATFTLLADNTLLAGTVATPANFKINDVYTPDVDLRNQSGTGSFTQGGDYWVRTAGLQNWKFDSTGNVTFPDNVVYTGNTFVSPNSTSGNLNAFAWKFSDTTAGTDTVTLQWNLLDTTFDQWFLTTGSQSQIWTLDSSNQQLSFGNTGVGGTGAVTFGTAANSGVGNVNDIELTSFSSNVYVRANNNSWQFDNTGNLTLPTNGSINLTGGNIAQTVNNNLNISVDDPTNDGYYLYNSVNNSGSPVTQTRVGYDGFAISTDLTGTPKYWNFNSTGKLSTPGDIFGPDSSNVSIGIIDNGSATSNVTLKTISFAGEALLSNLTVGVNAVSISTDNAAHNWTFDNTGNLTIPGAILAQGVSSPAPVISGFEFVGSLSGDVSTTGVVITPQLSSVGNVTISTGNVVNAISTINFNIGGGASYGSLGVGVALGYNAGNGGGNIANAMQSSGIAIGTGAAEIKQGTESLSVGKYAARFFQGNAAIAVGTNAAQNSQGDLGVAIGAVAGFNSQGANSVAIGFKAGESSQGTNSVAIGIWAGNVSQGGSSVAVGASAGTSLQGVDAVAVGTSAGERAQGAAATALGFVAGQISQGGYAVAIGSGAGYNSQGTGAIAIGADASPIEQGANAIAIGAGVSVSNIQPSNSIIIDATGTSVAATGAGLFVAPVRNDTANVTNAVYYNTASKEITYGPASSAPVAEALFVIQNANFNATAGSRYGVDTSSGSVTATLPEAPPTGTAIFFADAGGVYATNNFIIDGAGASIMGGDTTMTVSTNNQSVGVFWTGATWRIYNAG